MRRLRDAFWFAGMLACTTLAAAQADADPGAAPSSRTAEAWEAAVLDVRINGAPQEARHALLRQGRRILAAREDIERWRLVLPARTAWRAGGIDHYDLAEIDGLDVSIDESSQSLDLAARPTSFVSSLQDAQSSRRIDLSASALGTFLDYDLAVRHDRRGASASGLLEGVVSGDAGVVSNTALVGRNAFTGKSGVIRLDTVFRRDDPATLTRLSIGDGVTQSGAWSTPMRFGGIQFGTRYDLRPDYITYPTPSLHGGAAVPSAVEVFVNDTLRYQGRVEAGPFVLANVPVLTGAGTMRYSVVDAMGVSRTVSTPYYVSANLLREGLEDYSVELGRTRLRYGETSFDYGRPFASGSWRRGLHEQLTVDLHAEAGARMAAAGAGAAFALPAWGEFALHVAGSTDAIQGSGRLVRGAYARSGGGWNFSASRQVTSENFTQLAWQDGTHRIRQQTQLFLGRTLGRMGSVGVSHTALGYSGGEQVAVTSASWSMALGERTWLGVFATRTQQQARAPVHSIGVTLSILLGERIAASTSVQQRGGRTSASVEAAQNVGSDLGWGWRTMASRGENQRDEASAEWHGAHGVLAAEAMRWNGEVGLGLRASGTVGSVGGVLFAGRRSEDAFALVDIPGARKGTQIFRENQLAGETDASGRAVIPGLRAYEANHLSVDASDLPIEARLRNEVLRVVPTRRGFARAKFDVSHELVANIVVRLPDGRALPPGLDLRSLDRAEAPMSGFNGLAAIDDPRPGERFEVRWRDGHCSFVLGEDTLDDAAGGIHVCRPIEAAGRGAGR